MSGFALGHYLESPRNIVAAMRFILWNYWRGKLKPFVQVEKGIDSFGAAIEKLLNGENTGRLIVDVTGDL
jgi:NADPH-dependent curcumin reductase CurA